MPNIVQYDASSVPIPQLGLSSESPSQQELFDYGQNFIRTHLATVQGASVPPPFGGESPTIMVDLDPNALHAKRMSASDVSSAIAAQNLILPAGTAKIGGREYFVQMNSSPTTVEGLNALPLREQNGSLLYVRDVAQVRQGHTVQTNIVRQDGRHATKTDPGAAAEPPRLPPPPAASPPAGAASSPLGGPSDAAPAGIQSPGTAAPGQGQAQGSGNGKAGG